MANLSLLLIAFSLLPSHSFLPTSSYIPFSSLLPIHGQRESFKPSNVFMVTHILFFVTSSKTFSKLLRNFHCIIFSHNCYCRLKRKEQSYTHRSGPYIMPHLPICPPPPFSLFVGRRSPPAVGGGEKRRRRNGERESAPSPLPLPPYSPQLSHFAWAHATA